MKHLALIGLLLTGCVARSATIYPFQPPVDGVAIRAEDWAACDRFADRSAPYEYHIAGPFLPYLAYTEQRLRTPAEQAVAYEAAMRACLRGKHYPVAGEDIPGLNTKRPDL